MITTPSGQIIEGNFVENKLIGELGYGIEYMGPSGIYAGQFYKEKKHGKGKIYKEDGRVI